MDNESTYEPGTDTEDVSQGTGNETSPEVEGADTSSEFDVTPTDEQTNATESDNLADKVITDDIPDSGNSDLDTEQAADTDVATEEEADAVAYNDWELDHPFYDVPAIEQRLSDLYTDATDKWTFEDEYGNTMVIDNSGNEWHYFSDEYTYFYSSDERVYYWFDPDANLVYAEQADGNWWGPDTELQIQCHMNKQGGFLVCYDIDGNVLKYDDDSNDPFVYYNPYGDMWYIDDSLNIYSIDSEGNQELFYNNGDYNYYGADGSTKFYDSHGNGFIIDATGEYTQYVQTDDEGNVWGHDTTGNAYFSDIFDNKWTEDAEGNQTYTSGVSKKLKMVRE